MSRALLLRHGESAHNAHTGREALADAEGDRLTARGIEQAQAAGPGLAAHGVGESFEDLVARVRRLKARLEALEPGELPLVVGHGIFNRFFLLDSVLGDEFEPAMAAGIWNLGSYNCGLSLFSHGEARDPGGTEIPGWTCLSWMQRPWDPP